jgi:N-hydroxyarylamine O-acetyltransferase
VSRPAPDLAGLRRVYAAWCAAVPFDNVRKMVHLAEGRPGPLPGSSADDFFAGWLEHGAGGTCWAGNGALHDLLAALGFEVERAVATMLATPDTSGPNHGSVVVSLGGERWIADASILSGEPLRLPGAGEAPAGPLPRAEWRDGTTFVVWRTFRDPGGFLCRFERIGVDAAEWDALHQRTAAWSPFNYSVNTRIARGSAAEGFAGGKRFSLSADGAVAEQRRDREGRDRYLVEELGISADLVARLPDDRPVPPSPASAA